MKKLICLSLLTYLSFSIFSQTQTITSDAYSPENTKAFANDLFDNGFWDEAESEYKRYLFSTNQNDEATIFALTTIYNEQNNKTGIMWLENNFADSLRIPVREKIDFTYSKLLFLERNPTDLAAFTQSINQNMDSYSKQFQFLLTLSSDVLQQNITQATETAKNASQTYDIFSPTYTLLSEYKTKSPGTALFLSIICPGAGKIYTGSIPAFTTSFLTISTFVAGTIYSVNEYGWQNWRPYIFGGCALILYIVDIYGSYQGALRYNDAQNRKLCEEIDKIYEALY